MFKKSKVASGVLVALGGVLLAAPVFAQTADRVEITGTRIKSIDAASNSPVTSLTAEEIRSSQPVAVEEVIRGMAAAVPAIGPGVNNGAGGGATIDLRGLGPQRTLVLIDGRRMVPFDLSARVDTNSIPLALLERIDIVTGGASAVYGADAIAGVANFVLKKKFNGAELSTSYSVSGDNDAKRRRTDLTIGSALADGKGNVVLSVGSTTTDPLQAGDRSWGRTTTSSSTGAFAGSSTTYPIVIAVTPAAGVTTAQNTLGTGNRQLNLTTGAFEAFVPATGGYNTNPPNYFITPLDRRQVTGLANYTINEHAEVYAQAFYTRSDVNSVLAPSGTFGNTFQVNIGNPYIPDAARAQICAARGIAAASCVLGNTTTVPITLSRRFVELGNRYNDFYNKSLQTTLGLKGAVTDSWSYDLYHISGESDQTQVRRNWGSLSKVQQAMLATSTTACTVTTGGCVPLNVFGALGSITPDMLNFVNLSTVLLTKVRQSVDAATIDGDLGVIKSPFAKSPIRVAVGFEKREVSAANQSDAPSQIQAEVLGTGAPTPDRSGTLRLREAYGEANVPLVQGLPMAHDISLEVGGRSTEFSAITAVGTSKRSYGTDKFGLNWEPVKGVRIRGMVQKATRAPNVNELFAPQITGLSNLSTDPCQGALINAAQANTPGTLSNLCRLTGVPATVIGNLPAPSSGQINVLSGGNPDLGPEKADTQTLGFVWTPDFAPGFSLSMDRYRINVTDAISSPSTTDVLDGCYNAAFNPGFDLNASCQNIFRSANTGTFNGGDSRGVFTGSSNQGKIWIGGFDINASYRMRMKDLGLSPDLGTVDLTFNYNKVLDNDFQATSVSVRRDCIGYYSLACGAPNWGTRFTQRTTWKLSTFDVGYAWRHVSAIQVEPLAGTFYAPYSKVPAYNYLDLSANWDVMKGVRLSLSINNAMNNKPPVVGNTIATTSTNGGETLPSSYDTIGRYFTLGLTMKF
jgi:outer membrane receptor protein involved in Fe transport